MVATDWLLLFSIVTKSRSRIVIKYNMNSKTSVIKEFGQPTIRFIVAKNSKFYFEKKRFPSYQQLEGDLVNESCLDSSNVVSWYGRYLDDLSILGALTYDCYSLILSDRLVKTLSNDLL